jgi:hypothetical protein
MKKLRSFRPAWVLLTAVIPLLGSIGRAQLPEGAAGGMNAALTQLFGRATFFSAKVDVVVLDPAQQELLRMPMNFAALEGKIRLEIDVSQIRSKHVTPEIISAMNQAGIGKMATIIRPDKKASYILYPVLRNYSVVPMSKAEADAIGKPLNTERTELGKETIDGHSCVKNHVTVKEQQTVILEATTWNATDLKDFPIRIETKDKGTTSILHFHQIQFARPDIKQFEPPPGYKLAG